MDPTKLDQNTPPSPTIHQQQTGAGSWSKITEEFVIICGLAVAAYLGALIRIGIGGYYVMWDSAEINYSILWANLAGSILMGFVTRHISYFKLSPSRFLRIMYPILTTGLCGSITTFSSWSFECNKSFFLEWQGKENVPSLRGGRLIEWIVAMWIGVATPLMALRLGHHVALLSPYSDLRIELVVSDTNNVLGGGLPSSTTGVNDRRGDSWKELCIVIAFVVSTILIFIPLFVAADRKWSYLTYTGLLGLGGVYLRWKLSRLNTYPPFPIGTFVANILGTWILAVLIIISKFIVPYNDSALQGLLYALIVGFCGCLTTVSTLVHEIDSLEIAPSYIYGIATNLVAQIGLILIYNVYAYYYYVKDPSPGPPHTITSAVQINAFTQLT